MKKPILILALIAALAAQVRAQSQNTATGNGTPNQNFAGGGSGSGGLSATPTTLLPQQANLLWAYWKLPTENPCAWIDYSGHGNNATGCSGTAPTIQTDIGGAGFSAISGGSISYPATVNGANTIALVTRAVTFTPSNGGTNQTVFTGTDVNHRMVLTFNYAQAGAGSSGFNQGFTPLLSCSPGSTIGWVGPASPTAPAIWIITNNGTGQPQIYYNGYFMNPQAAAVCFGQQTSGNFQEGNSTNNLNGYIGPTMGWSVNFSAQDALVATQVIREAMQVRGFDWSQCQYNQPNINGQQCGEYNFPIYHIDGDSLFQANAAGAAFFPTNINGTVSLVNNALSAQGLCGYGGTNGSGHDARFAIAASLANGPKGLGNAEAMWLGTDDSGTSSQQLTQCYISAAQVFKSYSVPFFPITMPDRSTFDTKKNTFVAAMRQNKFAFDLMGDMTIWVGTGADGASANTNVFTDGTHFTIPAQFKFIAPSILAPYNHYFGAQDWSTATTDSSAPPAPTAITAITESGNTVTITTAGTPATCFAGQWAQVIGQTGVATYNDFYWIESTTGTTIVGRNLTSGLGAGTATGTVSCPSQKDADNYKTLNFGASANTWFLQPMEYWMGGARSPDRCVHITNINAGASVIGGFTTDHTQTINGSATFSLAAHTSVTLCPKPNATSAGGGDWITQ